MGDRIASARVEAGLMQGEFAQALGVAANTVSRWETGQRVPNTATLRRIAAATGKPLSYFLADAPDAEAQTPAGQQVTATVGGVTITGTPEEIARTIAELQRIREGHGNEELRGAAWPGIRALLSDERRCEELQVTDGERSLLLRGYCDPVGPVTVRQAELLLQTIRRMGQRPADGERG